MWWKLSGLVLLIAALCILVIPMRTHAAMYDPSNPPQPPTLRLMVANMYLTPTAGLLLVLILASAAFVAFKVIRGQW